MNREEFLRDCWAYYMMLEEKFIHTLDFVALSTDNEATYSNEYAGLIQMIGVEMDSFSKNTADLLRRTTRTFPTIIPL